MIRPRYAETLLDDFRASVGWPKNREPKDCEPKAREHKAREPKLANQDREPQTADANQSFKMCTLTFIPKPQGYLLGMNRDERLTREPALPPVAIASELPAVHPRESGGGTWIGSNAAGITFALLNQNPGPNTPRQQRSRGEIIPVLLAAPRFPEAMRRFQHIELHGVLPFLLVGFFPAEQLISQCQWDGARLQFFRIGWDVRHWFSSGVSDEMARKVRGSTCYQAWRRRDAASAEWLRGLHASHSPVRGSFSICVHRPDAATVSYTEIAFTAGDLTMRYHAGHPCQALGRFDTEVSLPPRPLHARSA